MSSRITKEGDVTYLVTEDEILQLCNLVCVRVSAEVKRPRMSTAYGGLCVLAVVLHKAVAKLIMQLSSRPAGYPEVMVAGD